MTAEILELKKIKNIEIWKNDNLKDTCSKLEATLEVLSDKHDVNPGTNSAKQSISHLLRVNQTLKNKLEEMKRKFENLILENETILTKNKKL